MEQRKIRSHISHQYDAELADLRSRVLAMGGQVEQQLADAVRAFSEHDAELAQLVVTNDYKINAQEVSIDEDCTQILVRRQPAAGDLRLLIAVIKTITDLERIGDEAERVGRMALHLAQTPHARRETTAPFADIEHLGEHVRRMLHDALDSFARLDVELAVGVAREDVKVDREYEGIMRQLITFMMEDPRSIPNALDVMWSARSLERIGDRSRNICEYVIYLVKGKDVRHTSLEHMEEEARSRKG
jgi:phosphate transport system protein